MGEIDLKISISLRKSIFKFSKLNIPIIFSYALDGADYGKNKNKFRIVLNDILVTSFCLFLGAFESNCDSLRQPGNTQNTKNSKNHS